MTLKQVDAEIKKAFEQNDPRKAAVWQKKKRMLILNRK